jgi:hypothetical protein
MLSEERIEKLEILAGTHVGLARNEVREVLAEIRRLRAELEANKSALEAARSHVIKLNAELFRYRDGIPDKQHIRDAEMELAFSPMHDIVRSWLRSVSDMVVNDARL